MSATDVRFAGSIPESYDQYLVSLIFEPYARDLAARVRDLTQGALLEVAAGTGAVTRLLAQELPETVHITATDLNEAMLAVAQTRAHRAALSWRQADAQKLPFGDASVDAVLCQFGVMFLPQRALGYREARRVLKPDGRYIFNTWDRLEHNEVTLIVARAIAELFPEDPPRFIERAPFGYHDVARVRADLEAAGFERIEIETVEKVTRAPSAAYAAIGLCQGTPLRGEIEERDATRLAEATEVATRALLARFGEGPFDNRMQAHVVTAWR